MQTILGYTTQELNDMTVLFEYQEKRQASTLMEIVTHWEKTPRHTPAQCMELGCILSLLRGKMFETPIGHFIHKLVEAAGGKIDV